MTSTLLKIYHCLPAPMRSIAASVRGYQLRAWRYGPATESIVAAALARERQSAAQIREKQLETLALVLHRAATRVPYYREHWQERRKRGDHASWEQLENWPILEKETLRQRAREFVADDCQIKQMFHDHTSGTTGKSLDLWFTKESVQRWYALSEARWRRWYDVRHGDRWAILGGQLIAPVHQRRPPFWVWNHGLRQLYMSSYHLSPDLMPHYLNALEKYRIKYVLGYPSALYALAQTAVRLRRQVPLSVVIANAEPLFAYQRPIIEQAFACPVRETYGMAEAVAAASECEAGTLHLWPEVGWLELFENGQPVTGATNAAGEIIATSLLNQDMPLIRYRVGDRAEFMSSSSEAACACGRTLPRLAALQGRNDELLYTPDGRCIGRLDPIFKANLPVIEAQIIQERLHRVKILFVPATDYTESAGEEMRARLRERMGDIEVVLEKTAEIPRTAAGKLRAVLCQLPPEELAAVRALPTKTNHDH